MVQSVCLTSRGSGVRIPQLPQSGDDRIGHLLFFIIPLYPYFRYFIGHPSLTRTVPKTVQKPPLPRGDVSEASVGRVAVPKTGQKTPLPCDDVTEAAVGRVAVPKTVQKPSSPREDDPEVPVSRVPVPKCR